MTDEIVVRIRAAVRLLFPTEMTPTARHILETILDEYDTRAEVAEPEDREAESSADR